MEGRARPLELREEGRVEAVLGAALRVEGGGHALEGRRPENR